MTSTQTQTRIHWRGIFPTMATDPAELAAAAKRKAIKATDRTLFHGVRLPYYWSQIATPRNVARGGGVAVCRAAGFLTDQEGRAMKRASAHSTDPDEKARWVTLRKAHQEDRNFRLAAFGAAGAAGFIAHMTGATGFIHEPLFQVPAFFGATTGLGLLGRPVDAPEWKPPVASSSVFELKDSMILDALRDLGISKLTKALEADRNAVRFRQPVARKKGCWTAIFSLPGGVSAEMVVERANLFVSNLGEIKRSQVMMVEGDAANRIHLTVSDRPMSEIASKRWPLLDVDRFDIFERYPLGVDLAGEWISMRQPGTNILIGGVPESGKTADIRVHIAAGALDPRVALYVFDLKGNGDFDAFSDTFTRYGVGSEDDVLDELLRSLRWLRQECRRRTALVRASELCPEGKVTSAAASQVEGLHPILFVIDEVQELLTDDERGGEAAKLMKGIVKLGRAQGVTLLYATQTPTAESLPTEITKSTGTRICHRVMDHETNDRVLPSGSYRAGVRATTIPEGEKGGAFLVGGGYETAKRLRFVYLTPEECRELAAKAIEVRGGPVDRDEPLAEILELEIPRKEERTMEGWIADILAVSEGEEKIQSQQILERLQEAFPGRYEDAVAASVTGILRGFGVEILPSIHKKDTVDPKTGEKKPSTRAGISVRDLRRKWEEA